MDLSDLANKLGFTPSDSKRLVRKAAELRRLADIQFNSSVIGVVCRYLHILSHFAIFSFIYNLIINF